MNNVIIVTGAMLTAAVGIGGLVFAGRLLWRFFQNLLGGPTWRD